MHACTHVRTQAHIYRYTHRYIFFILKEGNCRPDLFVKTVEDSCSIYCLRMKYSKDKNSRQHESQPRTLDWNRCISVAHSRGKQFASATFSIPLLTPTSSPTGIPRRDYLHRPWQKYNFSPPQTCHCLPKRAGRGEGGGGARLTANLWVLPWRTPKRGQWVEVETDQWARGFYLPSRQGFSSSLFQCSREAVTRRGNCCCFFLHFKGSTVFQFGLENEDYPYRYP